MSGSQVEDPVDGALVGVGAGDMLADAGVGSAGDVLTGAGDADALADAGALTGSNALAGDVLANASTSASALTPGATPSDDPPEVSVLIPIYNVQAYLDQCLNSLVTQTFTNFEAICINDGSTDGSLAIIESYMAKDARFKLINKTNSGYGASMNRGLDAARGNYIAILESDDWVEPGALQALYASIKKYDAEVAKANCYLYWTSQPGKNTLLELVPKSQTDRLVNPQEERDIFFLTPAIWSGMYKRSFLQAGNIRFTETPGASYQDAAFNFKIWVCATRAVFLSDAYLHYRQDNEASSVNSPAKVFCVCDECQEMKDYLAARRLKQSVPEWTQGVRFKVKLNTYVWNYERLSEQLKWQFLERFAEEMHEEEAGGFIDWQILDEWKVYDLKNILNSPKDYHDKRIDAGSGKLGKLKFYLKVGGLPLVAKIVKEKLGGR